MAKAAKPKPKWKHYWSKKDGEYKTFRCGRCRQNEAVVKITSETQNEFLCFDCIGEPQSE